MQCGDIAPHFDYQVALLVRHDAEGLDIDCLIRNLIPKGLQFVRDWRRWCRTLAGTSIELVTANEMIEIFVGH